MKREKSLVEEYKDKLKERENYLLNLKSGNNDLNNKNLVQNQQMNNINIKQKWFNSGFSNTIEKNVPSTINLKNYLNNNRNIMNERYNKELINNNNHNNSYPYNRNNENINNRSINIKSPFNNENNKNIYEKIFLSNSINNNYFNENYRELINGYRTPFYENISNSMDNYKARIKRINLEKRIENMNNLYNELKKSENLENSIIDDWRRNNNLGYKLKKEWGKDDKIYELKRVKRRHMDLENLLISKIKNLKEEKWELEIQLNEKKYYNNNIGNEYNIEELNKLQNELKDKEDRIKYLELATEQLDNKINNNEKKNKEMELSRNESWKKKLENRNREIDLILDNQLRKKI
jgi:hypothetical protein